MIAMVAGCKPPTPPNMIVPFPSAYRVVPLAVSCQKSLLRRHTWISWSGRGGSLETSTVCICGGELHSRFRGLLLVWLLCIHLLGRLQSDMESVVLFAAGVPLWRMLLAPLYLCLDEMGEDGRRTPSRRSYGLQRIWYASKMEGARLAGLLLLEVLLSGYVHRVVVQDAAKWQTPEFTWKFYQQYLSSTYLR